MTTLLVVAFVVFALILAYVVGGRTWLRSKPWTAGFFAWIEPIEIALFKKSETILWARLKILTGLILTGLTSLGAIDLTPVLPLIPDAYEGVARVGIGLLPMLIAFVGMIDEGLRKTTTLPIEIVSLPTKDVTPAVAEAVQIAEVAKEQAVAVITEAKS